jgi:hypothetical protein
VALDRKKLAWAALIVSAGLTLASLGGPLGLVNGACLLVITLLVVWLQVSEKRRTSDASRKQAEAKPRKTG